eukprot:1076953-Prorocentrum_minimum.AAC.1
MEERREMTASPPEAEAYQGLNRRVEPLPVRRRARRRRAAQGWSRRGRGGSLPGGPPGSGPIGPQKGRRARSQPPGGSPRAAGPAHDIAHIYDIRLGDR